MAIKNIQTVQAGLVGVLPSLAYIYTSDTEVTVLTTGYLNHEVQQGAQFSLPCMACVTTQATPTAMPNVGWYQVSHVGTNWSLVSIGSPGDVVLPTIANHIATYTNISGELSEDPATAITGGNLQAGLSGTAGYLASFPATAAKGSLRLVAVANTGNTLVTISNALHGQASVYSIPDSGAATANFLISALSGTQHITAGAFQVDAGAISSGLATGGFIGLIRAYPTTTSSGFIALQGAVNGSGNFGTTISNTTTQAQSQVVSIPDVGAATGQFLAKTAALVSGNFPQNSGTAGLVIDSGLAVTNIQQKTQVKAVLTGNIGGSGAGPLTVSVAGMTNASVVVCTVSTSSNACYVLKATPGTGSFALTVSADPGASLVVSYIAYIAAQ